MREQRPNKLNSRQAREVADRLKARRQTKETLSAIAQDYGVSHATIAYHEKKLPPAIRFKPVPRQVDEAEVLRLYGIHMHQGTVAQILGVPSRTISRTIARLESSP
ncbi:DNA-binding XRE family transcriptional regulator [Microvirga lupini]|uniref:DNA-binding XRE family transcriptional regulator n=1 Tax=Microvirga lupini TaxID=420324 RepID=A0A7W4VNY4_9HYPH|nr:hypothetical protein [Microvirga lupini]MBB3020679.1 DNA-binding XRE family transcriptional regulator [Microvirga lupini]